MIIVDKCIVSEDIADKEFACNLNECKGLCCIEGDAGAPLEEDEIEILYEIYDEIKPYMTESGISVVEDNDMFDFDSDGKFCTPLINGKDCVYLSSKDGIALCAIERAFMDKKIGFRKPISCHLYPIRVVEYKDFSALNYHHWKICCCDSTKKEPLYRYLKEPLIRKFGEVWYQKLCKAIEKE